MNKTPKIPSLPLHPGLEGIVVAESRLTKVDGEAGELTLRGYPIASVAGNLPFEGALHLLWTGEWPTAAILTDCRAELGAARVRAFETLATLGQALAQPDGMDALRAGLSHLRADNGGGDPIAACAATATLVAAWLRLRAGKTVIAPSAQASHATDFLRMAGLDPTAETARALDAYLATVIDHGMNASTFAARVVTSTGSDLISAVVAGVGALKGPLHGGAPGPVLDMLDAIATPERAHTWLCNEIEAGRRIMGMGHRVYRVRDPRAAVLEVHARHLAKLPQHQSRIALARAVELAAEQVLANRYPTRQLRANVEFYTALVLEAVGLPRTAFAPVFAIGRVAGWCAHIAEQRQTGRLIRPRARYVGPRSAA